MSIEALNWAWHQENLQCGPKLTLLALANFADDEHKSWPKLKTLERLTGLCHVALINNLAKLKTLGLLKTTRRINKASIYELQITAIQEKKRSVQKMNRVGTENEPGSVQKMNRKSVQKMNRIYSYEPSSTNPSKNIERSYRNIFIEKKPSAPRRATKCSLPDDFVLDDTRREYAQACGVLDPDNEFESFRNHHLARGNLMVDWSAAWQNWCRNDRKFRRERGNGKLTPQEILQSNIQTAKEWLRSKTT